MQRPLAIPRFPTLLALVLGCADAGGESDDTATGGESGATTGSTTGAETTGDLPDPLPPLEVAPLTTEETIVPDHVVAMALTLDPRSPAGRDQLLAEGYGDYSVAGGEPVIAVTPDGSPAPAPGPNPALLTRFLHLADTQLTDDESPTRLAAYDNADTSGAFRAQEAHQCQILNAAVRTINAIHGTAGRALEIVLLGGDNADSAQTNEVDWFQGILRGAPVVHCDSGTDDDPVAGPDNDPKDPFAPVGLDVPWRWVTGNHDVLVQGNLKVGSKANAAVGENAPDGTRDWSMPGGPVVQGTVAADPERALLDRGALMAKVSSDGDGHGIDLATAVPGKAYYWFDLGGGSVRVIVLDSAAETGADRGVIHQADVDGFILPALDQAEADGKLVILTSHHASGSLGDGTGLGGTPQPDALTTAEWQALVGGYANVLMHLAGHSHQHTVLRVEPPGGAAYWEVRTAALADFPHQMRILEVYDQDNGWVSIRGIAVDYATDGDPLAADGRALGILDHTSGWTGSGAGTLTDRNVELWVQKP